MDCNIFRSKERLSQKQFAMYSIANYYCLQRAWSIFNQQTLAEKQFVTPSDLRKRSVKPRWQKAVGGKFQCPKKLTNCRCKLSRVRIPPSRQTFQTPEDRRSSGVFCIWSLRIRPIVSPHQSSGSGRVLVGCKVVNSWRRLVVKSELGLV